MQMGKKILFNWRIIVPVNGTTEIVSIIFLQSPIDMNVNPFFVCFFEKFVCFSMSLWKKSENHNWFFCYLRSERKRSIWIYLSILTIRMNKTLQILLKQELLFEKESGIISFSWKHCLVRSLKWLWWSWSK